MRKVHDTQRRPGAPRHQEDQAGRQIEGRHPGGPDRPPGPPRRRRDPKAAVRASGQDGDARKEPPGRRAGDGTVDRPGARRGQAGSRVRFRPASGTGEPAHPDPAKAGGRATDHGTGTDTDTGVRLTACRSPRRSFPPRSEGRSWRGATGWPEKKPGAASRGRRHSFVAGTDVHHPTDRSLPMDAARCMVRDVSRACGGPGPPGWRRKEYLCGKLRKGYLRVATSRLANPRPRDVEAPLRLALKLADRAEAGRAEIGGMLGIPGPSDSIRGFIGHVRHRADLTGRRILRGGTVPHRGKVHPISGPHTRWISKGKAGVPVEPGVPVRLPEDRHGFLPHHSVMWEGSDVDVAVPMGGEARGPGSRTCRW